jgi:PAS domain S-box-containing protein
MINADKTKEELSQELEVLKQEFIALSTLYKKTIKERELEKKGTSESRERLNALFQSMAEMAVVHELVFNEQGEAVNYRIIDCNRAFTEVTGIKKVDAVGKLATEVYQIETPPYIEVYSKVAMTGEPKNFTTFYAPMNKHFTISVVSPKQNQFATISNDITSIKRIEDDLRESEEEFRSTFEQVTVGMAHVSPEGKWLRVNRQLCDMLGYSHEELLTKTFQDITYPDDLDVNVQKLHHILTNDIKSFSDEKRYITKDGEIIWVNLTVTAHRSTSGNTEYMISVVEDITERKLAKELKLTSELRYRRLFESAKDGILILDAETGKIVDVNPYLIEMLGYSKEQFIEKAIWDIGFFKDIVANHDNFLELQRKEYVRYENLPLETANGLQINVEFVSNIYLVNNHKVIQCNIRDITERKRAEELVLENEEKYKRLLKTLRMITDNVSDMIWAKDLNNHYIFANKAMCEKLLNAENTDEPIGKDDMFFAERERNSRPDNPQWHTFGEICRDSDPIVIETKKTHRFDEYGNVKNKFLFLDVIKSPLYDEKGELIGTVGAGRDITNEKKIEKELQESEEKFRLITENSADAIFIIDNQGRYVYVNTETVNMLGYSKEEMLMFTIADISPKNRVEEYQQIFQQLLEKGRFFTEFELVKKDGTIFPTDFNAVVLQNGFVYASCRDISERKHTEEELTIHRNNLKELVQLRTQEWNNANEELQIQIEREKEIELMLEQSLEKEKELSEMQSRFISTTSHEFRTPLTAILSSTELLQRYGKKWSEDKQKDHFNRIIKSVEYLTKLLDDVLTISRTETGKINFKPETVELFQLISECEKDNKSLLTEKHEFRLNYNLEEKEFQLDRKLMRFIINNLLSNAIKYSPAGGKIRMTINQDQEQLIIEISDEGIGIPQEEVDKIFDSFYRSKNTGTIEGTGLGLAIVKRAIDIHNGEIIVSSELNKGTTFNIKIPLKVA